MKMTPEQKAFRDYGIALGELKRLRKELIFNLAHYLDIKKNGAILIFRKCLGERAVLIKDAWQKRAACRRTCMTCNHFGDRNISCRKCKASGEWVYPSTRAYCHYFEPRKEGE